MSPVDVLLMVTGRLDQMGVPYMVAGSFASSSYGLTRFTQDADLVLRLDLDRLDDFVEAFRNEFYVDKGMIEQAVRTRSSFNLIHYETSFKVDCFLIQNNPFHREAFSRRHPKQMKASLESQTYVQTPEDTILSKLDWYRQGGCVSEQQWRDVIGVLKVQAGRLDPGYLAKWAAEIGVFDLLERAFGEAGLNDATT